MGDLASPPAEIKAPPQMTAASSLARGGPTTIARCASALDLDLREQFGLRGAQLRAENLLVTGRWRTHGGAWERRTLTGLHGESSRRRAGARSGALLAP